MVAAEYALGLVSAGVAQGTGVAPTRTPGCPSAHERSTTHAVWVPSRVTTTTAAGRPSNIARSAVTAAGPAAPRAARHDPRPIGVAIGPRPGASAARSATG